MLVRDFNFHVENVNDGENLAFQDFLESFGLIQHVDCPTPSIEVYLLPLY